MKIVLSHLPSPLGAMRLATDTHGRVRALSFADRSRRLHDHLQAQYGGLALSEGPPPAAVADALQRYFDGALDGLDGIPTAAAGSELEQRVWAALRRIPAGQTTTYGALGRSLGLSDWRAALDVGAAVGANPIAILVPCHRVLGANGDLKGFAWGLQRKRWLLEHEAAIDARAAVPQTAALF